MISFVSTMPLYPKAHLATLSIRIWPPRLIQHQSRQSQRFRLLPTGLSKNARAFSTGGYGDDSGDPRSKHPEAQGVSQRSREIEHPGPPVRERKPESKETPEKSSSESSTSSSRKTPGSVAPSSRSIPRSAKEELENARKSG